jgi:hypothetical protein
MLQMFTRIGMEQCRPNLEAVLSSGTEERPGRGVHGR